MRRTMADLDKRIMFLEDQVRDARESARREASGAQHARDQVKDLNERLASKPTASRVTINVTGGNVTFNGTGQSGQ